MAALKEQEEEMKKQRTADALNESDRIMPGMRLMPALCPPTILKTAVIVAVALQALAMSFPLFAFAVSYFPAPLYHQQERLETPMKTGETVYLFHSGTADVRRSIHCNDVLTVYRVSSSCEVREVGKIRVVSYLGETYLKGEVIEGEVRADDIARKGEVSCLVIFAGICDHEK
jgi:hypothetical protein